MSWILGCIGRNPKSSILRKLHPIPLVQHESQTCYAASGGIRETCLSGTLNRSAYCDFENWIVVGVGIVKSQGGCRFITPLQWQEILAAPRPDFSKLDGHFAAIRWNNLKVECFTDQFGMRGMFLARTTDGVAFSTRSDWLARLTGNDQIDFAQFGSHWLTFNQFSHESIIKDLIRVRPNGSARCTADEITMSHTPWLPEKLDIREQDAGELIETFANPELADGKHLALGLSGGLDSRVLLAVMLSAKRQKFSLYLFGHPDEPDVRVAQTIAIGQHLEQQFFAELSPFPDNLLHHLQEYVGESQLVSPASLLLRLRFYSLLHESGAVIIDGGFGEIARRQFMNRALSRARSHMINGNTAELLPFVAARKASIFKQEVDKLMKQGVDAQLRIVWEEMPRIREIGIENFADLLVVRYRFPGYAGAGQSTMDKEIVSYMPFIQPSYVNAAFALPLSAKRNGKMYRRIIRTKEPLLMHYPLVKATTTYPFWMSTIPAWFFTRLKGRVVRPFVDPLPDLMLQHAKEFVLDTVESQSVRTFDAYDHPTIKQKVAKYYEGDRTLTREIEWWFSFELWRRSLQAIGE